MYISSRSPKLELTSLTHNTPLIAKKITKVTKRTNYILDTLLTDYTQQALMHASLESFTVCIQCKWANLHDDDNERE